MWNEFSHWLYLPSTAERRSAIVYDRHWFPGSNYSKGHQMISHSHTHTVTNVWDHQRTAKLDENCSHACKSCTLHDFIKHHQQCDGQRCEAHSPITWGEVSFSSITMWRAPIGMSNIFSIPDETKWHRTTRVLTAGPYSALDCSVITANYFWIVQPTEHFVFYLMTLWDTGCG